MSFFNNFPPNVRAERFTSISQRASLHGNICFGRATKQKKKLVNEHSFLCGRESIFLCNFVSHKNLWLNIVCVASASKLVSVRSFPTQNRLCVGSLECRGILCNYARCIYWPTDIMYRKVNCLLLLIKSTHTFPIMSCFSREV
jgi:hypothetical protein